MFKKGKDPYFAEQELFKDKFVDLLSEVHTFNEVRGWCLEPKNVILSMMSSYGFLSTHLMFLEDDVKIRNQVKYLDCVTDELGNMAVHLLQLSCMYEIYLPPDGKDPNDRPFSRSPVHPSFNFQLTGDDLEEKPSSIVTKS